MTGNDTEMRIPVNEPLLDGNEKKYLAECIETGWISSEGPFVTRFEQEFAHRVGRKHGVAVSNGTAALEAAVRSLGIGPGDEVIMPTFTIISCAAAVVRAGAVPVLVDSDAATWNMNVTEVEAKITSKTRAIMPVHIYGLPVDMTPLVEIAENYDLDIIEDAAEMHGQEYRGEPCGSFGKVSTFSFYSNKLVTTGEGGMIVTDDDDIAERCRSLRNLCFDPQKRFVHEDLGWNMRLGNLQAAVGLAQLERLDEFTVRKRGMGRLYTELLADCREFQLPLPQTEFAKNIYWIFGVVLSDAVEMGAGEAIERLAAAGVGARPFFWCMHEQPVFRKMGLFDGLEFPVAERLARRGLYLPSGLALTEDEIAYAAATLRSVVQ